jgi:hypothetical protein
MPLTPAATDRFQKVGNPGSATTLASPGYVQGNTSISVGSTTNHPTDTLYTFAIDRAQVVNGVETRIAGTYCEFEGIVTGASTIGSVVKKFGNGQDYVAGALTRVYIPVTGNRENALIDGLNQDHNGKGNHKTLTDDNANEWLERGQVASAVNQVKVSNNIAGKDPKISANGDDTNINLQLDGKGTGFAVARNPELVFDFIVANTGVWSGLGYGSTLTAAMTAATCYINGRRIVLAAIATRTFTASKDTYVDVLDNLDGTGTIVYTEVANNAASPALAANSVRMAIIVTGVANIASAGSVNQGQIGAILPIVASQPYEVTDSLGNLIYPSDPSRKIIGYRQTTANFSTTNNAIMTDILGLSCPIIMPTSAVGRKIKISLFNPGMTSTGAAGTGVVTYIREGSTTLATSNFNIPATSYQMAHHLAVPLIPSAGSHTYKGSMQQFASATASNNAATTAPAYIMVELI